MSIVKTPAKKAPWPPVQANDKFYRYPRPYPVGKEKGETFASIAKKQSIDGADLVHYNFLTKDGEEINWYLANYVGCPAPKAGQKYYEFLGAVFDAKKNTGVIFIPTFGKEGADYLNRFGAKVVENYNSSTNKKPGGLCYEASYARVKEAGKSIGAVPPDLDRTSTFGRLWGSHIKPKESWLKLPEEFRGKGAAGAMAWAKLGTLVEMDGIWRGELKPGAVIQVWKSPGDFERVKKGDEVVDHSWGHSFLFLNYVYSGSSITGMAIADQGFENEDPLAKGDYSYWVGANLNAKGGSASP